MKKNAIDLTGLKLTTIDEIKKEIESKLIFKHGKHGNAEFLIVNIVQRYLILQEAAPRDIDQGFEKYLGLKIAVINK